MHASQEPQLRDSARASAVQRVVAVIRTGAVCGVLGGLVMFVIEATDRIITLWQSFNAASEPIIYALYLSPVIFIGMAVGLVTGAALALVDWFVGTVERPLSGKLGSRARYAAYLAVAGVVTVAAGIGLELVRWRVGPRALRRIGVTLSLYFMDANAPLLSRIAHAAANWMIPVLLAGVFILSVAVAATPRFVGPSTSPRSRGTTLLRSCVVLLLAVVVYYIDSRFEYARYDAIFHVPASILFGILAFLAATIVVRASEDQGWHRSFARIAIGLAILAVVASGFDALHIGRNENVKALLWRRSVVARRAWAVAVRLSDRDGDGFSQLFAGGDLDDHNRGVNPLASEIPGNHIDDNCIGGDLARSPAASPTAAPSSSANGKRVILIAIDTLRADRMSLYGYNRPTTPQIAEHAKSGLIFDTAYSEGTNTAVAFAAMQTSSSRGGVFDPTRTRLFPRLAQAGYATAQVNAVPEDMWLRAKSSSRPYRAVILDGIHEFPHEIGEEFWDADKVTDAAIAYLSSIPPGAPSATWIHYFDPHTPRKRMPPFNFGDSASDNYDTEVAFADREIGRLLDWMTSQGVLDDSLVILTADHGESFLEHGMDFHGNRPYNEQVHIPMVVWAHGVAPERIQSPVSIIDVGPTIFSFTGLGSFPDAEGRSLLDPLQADRPIYSETPLNIVDGPFHAYAVTQGRWRYIWDVVGNTVELYDLDRDPRELHNLADSDPALASSMRATLAKWLDTTRSVRDAADAASVLTGD